MKDSRTGGDMNAVFTFLLGLLIGWLIEWLIDFVYWRRHGTEREVQSSGDATHVTRTSSLDNYDLFKTLVTAALATGIVLMLVSEIAFATAETFSADDATAMVSVSRSSIESSPMTELTDILDSSPSPLAVESTIEPAKVVPSSTLASVATEKSTMVPRQSTSTGAQETTCNTSVPSRMRVGQTARVVQRLRMRNDASIDAFLIQINLPNTQVEIIGGPVCTPLRDRAYLWWQIRLADGTEGWSAESPLHEASYFLEPVP